MKVYTTLCSLVAALALSITPAKAEKIKASTATGTKPTTEFSDLSNPTSETDETAEYELPTQQEPIPLLFDDQTLPIPSEQLEWFFQEKRYTLQDAQLHLDPNFIRQESGGAVQVRFEIPAAVSYDHFDKSFKMSKWYFKPNLTIEFTYDKTSVFYYFTKPNFPVSDFLKNVGIGGIAADTLLQQLRDQLPVLAQQQSTAVNRLWNEISNILENRKIETVLTFSSFFRDILPKYTSDGVVTPDELIEIQAATTEKLEDYYHTTLTAKEKAEINNALQQFSNNFNLTSTQFPVVQSIRSLLTRSEDPLSLITIAPNLNGKLLYSMFSDLKPLYSLTVDKNSFRLESNAYSRFFGLGDEFHTYIFRDHVFREGSQSLSQGVGEAHLVLQGEVHGGRPIRQFFADKYSTDFNTLELLLGYQPVSIDGTLSGNVQGFVHFQNLSLSGYEEIIPTKYGNLGIGLIHGYVYHLDADGEINLEAYADSFAYRAGVDLQGYLRIKESSGEHAGIYLFSWEEQDSFWHSMTLGVISEQLNVRDRFWGGNLHFMTDFQGRNQYNYSWAETTAFYRSISDSVLASFRTGATVGEGNPFFFMNTESTGAGIFAINQAFTFLIEAQFFSPTPSRTTAELLLSTEGEVNTKAARSYHRTSQALADSLFPAKQGLLEHAQQQYFSRLTGTFIELSSTISDEQIFPHHPPAMFRLGILTGKEGNFYSRFGYCGNFTLRNQGLYLALGNEFLETHFSILEEEIPTRESTSTSLNLGARLTVGEATFTGWTQLYTPALGHYLINQEKGDITYNISITGPLELLPITIDKIFSPLFKSVKIFY